MEERGHQHTCTIYYFNNVYKPPSCMSDQHYTFNKIVGLFVRGLIYPWKSKIESEFSRLIVVINNISGQHSEKKNRSHGEEWGQLSPQLFRHVGTQWKGSWVASASQTSAGLECSNVNRGLILTIQPEVECKPKAYKWQHKKTAKASKSTLGSF